MGGSKKDKNCFSTVVKREGGCFGDSSGSNKTGVIHVLNQGGH